jgi:hypothetical protein
MSFVRIVETNIREDRERGDFDNPRGYRKPVDPGAFFETRPDIRTAQSEWKTRRSGFSRR